MWFKDPYEAYVSIRCTYAQRLWHRFNVVRAFHGRHGWGYTIQWERTYAEKKSDMKGKNNV